MSYTQELRKFVAENFNQAEVKDPESVKKYTQLNSLLDKADKDYEKVVTANAELAKTLTEYATHTSVPVREGTPAAENAPQEVKVFEFDSDFDKALDKFLKEHE